MTAPKLRIVDQSKAPGRGPGKDAAGRPIRTGPGFKRMAPAKPAGMTAEASAWWDRVVPDLVAADVVSPVHAAALHMAAESWSRWVAAQALIAAEGLLSENSQGVVRHPAVAIVNEASKEYQGWARRFGLTPLDEPRVSTPTNAGVGPDNPFISGGPA